MSSPQEQTSSEQMAPEDQDLCPNCLTPNQSAAHFCIRCDAPMTVHAATDPMGSIAAAGHVYRKASSRPHGRLVLVGMWLIFAPLFVVNLPTVWFSFRLLISPLLRIGNVPSSGYHFFSAFGFFLIVLVVQTVFVAVLVKVTRNYRRLATEAAATSLRES